MPPNGAVRRLGIRWAALAALLGSAPLAAQGYSDPGFGIGLRAGAFRPPGGSSGAGVALAARYRLTGVLGFEAAIGFHEASYRFEGRDLASLRVVPLQFSLLASFRTFKPLQPYLLVGAGYYYVEARGRGAFSAAAPRSDNQFGLHAGAGLDLRLTRRLSAGLDARWTYLAVDLEDPAFQPVGGSFDANYFSATGYLTLYF